MFKNKGSRHTVVCCAAQETWGTRQTSVYFTGVKKMLFSHIFSSTLPEKKHEIFCVIFPWGGAPPISNLN